MELKISCYAHLLRLRGYDLSFNTKIFELTGPSTVAT